MNLCAVDSSLRFLRSLSFTWHVPRAVISEGVYLKIANTRPEVRAIDLGPCFQPGFIERCDAEDPTELKLYVDLARDLDDGEAMGLAVAKVRTWRLATDDRKARRKAKELGVPLLSTAEIVRKWAKAAKAHDKLIVEALVRIQSLARFAPTDEYPDAAWWRAVLRRPKPPRTT